MAVMTVTLEAAPKIPFNLDGRVLFSSGDLEMVHLTLQPGEKIEPHSQPFDVIFFVAEGTGELVADGKLLYPPVNSLTKVNEGMQRSWSNTSGKPLRLLVVKLLK